MNNFQSDLVFNTPNQDSPTCSSDVNVAVDDLTDIEMRNKLKNHIIKKTDTIRDKLQYVSLKYDIVKNLFDRYSLTILIVSALITLSDALKLLISGNKDARSSFFCSAVLPTTIIKSANSSMIQTM